MTALVMVGGMIGAQSIISAAGDNTTEPQELFPNTSAADSTSDSVAESIPDSAADSTSDSVAESTPDSAADSTSDSVAESTPDSAADSTSDSVAESTPDSAADSTSDSVAESIPDSTSDSKADDSSKTDPPPAAKLSIANAVIETGSSSYTYTGRAISPLTSVALDGASLTPGRDYTLSYVNNINAGTALIIVNGCGSYEGTAIGTFTISPKPISAADVALGQSSFTYSGKPFTPSVTVSLDGTALAADSDYTLSFINNVNAGTASVIVSGCNNYSGTVIGSFTISPRSLASAAVSISGKVYTYTGKAIKPAAAVTLSGATLKKGSDYTISYSGNLNTGRATVRVTGKGNYKSSKTAYFYIKPKAMKISEVKALGSRKVKVKLKKDAQATGYQIVLATNSSFTKNKKTVYLKKNTATAKTVTGLLKGRKYYIRARAYKTVGTKKYYGGYSANKTIKVK